MVTALVSKLDEHCCAIFYQTDGRSSGIDGGWLDKGFLCTLGARAAGAVMVWHRIVCAGRPFQIRNGRPAFARLVCFSRSHRCSASGVDVLPQRGFMSYAGAAGEAACSAAVQYVRLAHLSRPARAQATKDDAAVMAQTAALEAAALSVEAFAPIDAESDERVPLVFDPFCGHGTVLALANAWGMDSFGIELNRNRCQASLVREPKGEEDVFDHNGMRIGPIDYWCEEKQARAGKGAAEVED